MMGQVIRGISPCLVAGVFAVQLLVGLSHEARAGVWTNLGSFTPHNVPALAGDPVDPLIIYAGTGAAGMFATADGGATWSPANTGLTSPFILSLLADTTTAGTVYVGTNGDGIFKSTDWAANWSPVNTGLGDLNGLALVMDPTDPLTIYAATFAGVFKSTDGAATWSAASTGLTNLNIQGLAIDPTSPLLLYAATYGDGVFVSTDGAASWTASNTGLGFLYATDIAVDPHVPSTIYVGVGTIPTLYKSVDSGATWSATSAPSISFSITADPTVPGRVWLGGGGGLYRSSDYGDTWAFGSSGFADPFNTVQALIIHPAAPRFSYAGVSACCGHGPVYRYSPACGDGVLDPSEECDDLDLDNGDGCSSSCEVETCFSCASGEPSVCAPDDGLSCDDADPCTVGDSCSAGVCTTTPVECPVCEGCAGGSCVPAPRTSCVQSTEAGKSKLVMTDKTDNPKDRLLWNWTKGGEVLAANLGDPTDDSDYALCIYDGNGDIAFRATVPAGGTCDDKPCWKQLGSGGFAYKDKAADPAGVTKVKISPGASSKSKAKVKGKGDLLNLPDLGALTLPLLVQLQPEEPSTCVQETFDNMGVKVSSESKFVGLSE